MKGSCVVPGGKRDAGYVCRVPGFRLARLRGGGANLIPLILLHERRRVLLQHLRVLHHRSHHGVTGVCRHQLLLQGHPLHLLRENLLLLQGGVGSRLRVLGDARSRRGDGRGRGDAAEERRRPRGGVFSLQSRRDLRFGVRLLRLLLHLLVLVLRHHRGVRLLVGCERIDHRRGSLRFVGRLGRCLRLLRGWNLDRLRLGPLRSGLGRERAEAEEELGGFVVLVVQRLLLRLGPRRRRLRSLRRPLSLFRSLGSLHRRVRRAV
mmetsp:Transcript_13345/g.56405  ORF Transcript_13345/g.56405 Transcript_13345/m.56405 type:complete len:263 (+) Transcript_13345:1902-2690(+)